MCKETSEMPQLNPAFAKKMRVVVFLGLVAAAFVFGRKYLASHPDLLKHGTDASASNVTPTRTEPVTTASTTPIEVCGNTWIGHIGGQYFNGGFAASKDSRYWKDYHILVHFTLKDDFDASRAAFKHGDCNLLWQTLDATPTEIGGLEDQEPVIAFPVDKSRGADAIVATREVRTVADLRGKRVALLLGSPSHSLLMDALQAGGLKYHDVRVIATKDPLEAAKLFKTGHTDVAIVWSPDDEDCVQAVPGAHRLFTSRDAPEAIVDIFYMKKAWLDSHRDEVRALAEGWYRGNAEINLDVNGARAKAKHILVSEMNLDSAIVEATFDGARRLTYGDAVNFFNINGNYRGLTGQQLYESMGRLYDQIGMVTDHNLPAWRQIADASVIRSITSLSGESQVAEANPTFAVNSADTNSAALSDLPVTVTFETGSSVLTDDAKYSIDAAFGETAKKFASRHVRVEGNTDNTGTDAVNIPLSRARAEAVAQYLTAKYGFDPNRFIVVGNGATKPVASNETGTGRAKNRRTDFQVLQN
jgi:NitT/TauT family transport system substrate-binding protein